MSDDEELQRMVDEAVDRAMSARLTQVINRVLDQRRSVDEQTHRKHHQYIDDLLESRRRRRERLERVLEIVGGWAVILFLSGVGYTVYVWFEKYIKNLK